MHEQEEEDEGRKRVCDGKASIEAPSSAPNLHAPQLVAMPPEAPSPVNGRQEPRFSG
jgi:hypothetical protein